MYCYVTRHYDSAGAALMIVRRKDDVYAQFGDWKGTTLDPGDTAHPLHNQVVSLLENQFNRLVALMAAAAVSQAQFFFSAELSLVDVQLSLNKYVGPGMLRDVFARVATVPETLKIEVLDDRAMDFIAEGKGSYEGNLLLRPSRARPYEIRYGTYVPLCVEVRR